MSRESVAEMALNKAERELEQKLSQLSAEELEKVRLGWNDFSVGLSQHYDKFANTGKGAGYIFVVTSLGNILIDSSKGESGIKQALGLLGDGVVALAAFALRMTPYGGAVSIGNAVLGHFGIDLSSDLKWLYDLVFKDDEISIQNGYLRIEKTDGTVYMRPVKSQKIKSIYNITDESYGAVTGENKDDVLFGSKGNDMLIGHGGADLLIGGAGKDDYFVDNGDTIKDSDGKGRVFLSSTNIQLTGGTQIEKGSKIYKGKDGTTYELKGSDLIINDNITIENFSKISNDLGIVLVDIDDIVVTIGNNQSTEGGNGKHSMEFKITLNRALKKDEFLELIINGQRVKFKEGDIEQTYTHTWDGNTIKEEDRKFEVSGIVMQTSENLNVQAVVSGQGLIKDDDQDNDPDPELEASPIVIDLGNDGINSHALNYTINFDLDNNGFKEATGWVSGDDALLAIDKNNNGIIDNGSELFGNKSISDSAFSYTNSSLNNGFETLKAYDTNNDNIIDVKDAEFENLLLWQDKNSDGISETDELIKLSDKVKSINLNLLIA